MAGNHHNGRTNTRLSDAIRLNGETSINEIVPESTKFNDNETSEEPITVSASVSSSSSAMAETSTYFESVREQLERLGDPEEDFYGFGPDDVAEEELLLDPIEDLVVQYMASNEFINSRRDFSKQFQDESMDDEDDAEPAAEHTVATRPSSRTSDEGSSHGLAVKDVTTNEAFKKPFELGWIREFVYRAVPDPKISRNQGEVYYHTPSGKKLRSSRELKPYLSGGLTLENFTFSKVSLGVNDPSKEIIREAKLVNKRSSSVGTADALTPHVLGKRQPKRKVPKGASPPPEKSNIKAVNNRLNITNQRLSESRKTLSAVDIPGTSKGKLESGMLPPAWGGGPKRKSKIITPSTTSINPSSQQLSQPSTCKMNNQSKKSYLVMDPCSIQCLRAMGMIPTLQCQLCLCLFHNECVGLGGVESVKNYICPNCQAAANEKKSLTTTSITSVQESQSNPISIIRTTSPNLPTPPKQFKSSNKISDMVYSPSNQSLHLHVMANSKTQKSIEVKQNKNKFVTVPKYMKINQNEIPKHEQQTKSLVGSLTTWMPPSSDVQVRNSNEQSMVITQDIVDLNGRKYIVVPKHNVLSVSPQNHSEDAAELTSTEPTIPSLITSDKLELNNAIDTNDNVNNTAFIEPNHTISPVMKSLALNETTDNIKKKEDSVPSSYESATPPDQAESSSRQLVKNMLSKTPVPVPVMHQTQESVFEPQAGPSTGPSTGPSPGTTYTVPVQIFRCNRDPGGVTFVNEISLGVRLFKEIFKYLKVQDLLRCSRVNTLFNHIAMSPSLWKIVRLKNSAIVNIPAMCNTLIRLQTEKLDMKKALLHMPNIDNMWTEFSQNIGNVTSLLELALCRCPSRVVENIYQTNAGLRYFNAMAIHDEHLNLQGIQNMRYLRELRLRSVNGVRIETLGPLKELAGTLTFLNLTSVRGLGVIDCDVIGDLINLVNLEIGECCELPPNFGTETLSKLTSLKRVRFEKGLADVPTDNLLQAVSSMPKIEQLELINFDIKPRFDESLAMCANIKRLLIIPTYISQSATTNHLVLAGVYLLKDTLTSFMWAVTNELLRVTDLFVDQCGKNDSPGTPGPSNAPTIPKQPKPGENIPVLKPVPGYIYNPPLDPATSQVEIVPIKQLYKVLNDNLTNTTINIIKIPFSGTWRQYIPESVQC